MKHHEFFSSYPVIRFTVIAVLLCVLGMVASVAQAQTAAWDTNSLAWDAPTTCTTGEPISACAVTGYRVERSATTTGSFATVGSSTTTTYVHTGAVAGQNCYRVIAISALGESVPSNVACKTNTKPVGPPNPPTNLRTVATVVYNLKQEGRSVLLGAEVGRVALNTICGKQSLVDDYKTVARSNVRFTAPVATGSVLVAKCG